jgi:hypothetical protein
MRKFLGVVPMLLASPAFAQNWQTSVLQTRFVNTVSVSSSSTTDQVRLSGTMAALVQIQHPTDPCTPVDPCRSVPVRIIHVAEATGVGQSTGTTYRARRCVDSQGDAQLARYFWLAGCDRGYLWF